MRALLLVAGVLLAPRAARQDAPPHFRIVFTRTTIGYIAHCDLGCHWETVEFACGEDCHAVIDDAGVRVNTTSKVGEPSFAFQFHRTIKGFELTSLGGTAWKALSWDCGLSPCSAHVDERGVSRAARSTSGQ